MGLSDSEVNRIGIPGAGLATFCSAYRSGGREGEAASLEDREEGGARGGTSTRGVSDASETTHGEEMRAEAAVESGGDREKGPTGSDHLVARLLVVLGAVEARGSTQFVATGLLSLAVVEDGADDGALAQWANQEMASVENSKIIYTDLFDYMFPTLCYDI